MKFKNLSALIIAIAMAVCVFSACSGDAKKETSNKEDTKQTQEKDNKKGDDKVADDTKATDSGTEQQEQNVPVDHIKEAKDIQSGDELTSLINESNNPDTTPERREEILKILGEYLEGMGGEAVSIPAE